jgi:hypothetical protein
MNREGVLSKKIVTNEKRIPARRVGGNKVESIVCPHEVDYTTKRTDVRVIGG